MEALTHKSYYNEKTEKSIPHNERLEFLGDAVLGLIIVEHLFQNEHQYPESVLAKLKSYLVSETVFAGISESISLGKYLLLGKGEESTGGRDKKSILSDAFEATVGSVYLDAGYEKTKKIVLSFFKKIVNEVLASSSVFDYKTELQEKSQLLYGSLPEYRLLRQQGKDHKKIFTVAVFINGKKLGVATGKRKKEAETNAAQIALEKIET
jgi:ribonuclease-3